MNYTFDAPPEGALQNTSPERALKIEYRAMKTPQAFADKATQQAFADYLKNGSLGFQYYDKEAKQRVSLPEFTFVALEIYAGIEGYNDADGTTYWSNRAKDTRKESLTVFASNHQGPICSGLYQQIKADIPPAAKYTKYARAYCVQLDKVVEIKLTASVERGMQKAIAAAEMSAGRKRKWESVFVLSLPDNDHLWGFHLTGYNRETKEGEDYAGKGELYLAPVFHAGILNPVKQAALWQKCRDYQESERAAHEAYKARYQQAETVTETHTPQAAYQTTPNPNFPAMTDAPAVDSNLDDLPF